MVPLVRRFSTIFEGLPDRRRAQGKRHPLPAVMTLVVVALINQQNSLRQIGAWAQGLDPQARQRLSLRHNRVPSESTIRRVLNKMDVQVLKQAVWSWVREVLTAYYPTAAHQGLALDGKTLRHSRDAGQGMPALRVLNAMVHDLGVFIQAETIPADTNELGIIRPLLEEIVLGGRVVTLDAIFTNANLARIILDHEGEYLMRVKANQPRLLADLQTWFDDPSPFSQADNAVHHTTQKSHGRLVHYTLHTTEALNDYLQDVLHWPDVGQVFRLERRCTHLRTQKVTQQTHYAITSLTFHQADPATLLQFWRDHWHIENKGHWVLDVVFGEDASTARKAGLPDTLAVLRRAVITLLRLFGHDDITRTRSRLSANVNHALSLVGAPLEVH